MSTTVLPSMPTMPPPSYSIERAVPADMPDVVRIDDDATTLYAEVGLHFALHSKHPFAIDEQRRWRSASERGSLFFAVGAEGKRLGFASLDVLDGEPYLDQLSVLRSAMRRGVGRFLLGHAIDWTATRGDPRLWLTTYAHLGWNRPFYERAGFVVVPEERCGPAVRHHLAEQRRYLPAPLERVAMCRSLRVDPPTH